MTKFSDKEREIKTMRKRGFSLPLLALCSVLILGRSIAYGEITQGQTEIGIEETNSRLASPSQINPITDNEKMTSDEETKDKSYISEEVDDQIENDNESNEGLLNGENCNDDIIDQGYEPLPHWPNSGFDPDVWYGDQFDWYGPAESDCERYLETLRERIVEKGVDARKINTEQAAMDYVLSLMPESDDVECQVKSLLFINAYRRMSPYGYKGRLVVLLTATDRNDPNEVRQAKAQLWLEPVKDELEQVYVKKYEKLLDDLNKTGIYSSSIKTKKQAEDYIRDLVLKDADDRLEVKINIDNFVLFYNPKESLGYMSAAIIVRNKTNSYDFGGEATNGPAAAPIYIDIYPEKAANNVVGSSYSRKKRDRSSKSNITSNELVISRPNLTTGVWHKIDNKWKLLMDNGYYAISQWVYLKDKWYLIGNDGFMLTGWQKVNDKWYYMNENGELLVNTVTPDGYTVNENGEWVE